MKEAQIKSSRLAFYGHRRDSDSFSLQDIAEEAAKHGYAVVPEASSEKMIGDVYDMDGLLYERADGSVWVRWLDIGTVYRAFIEAGRVK